jgi:hypothetical protein
MTLVITIGTGPMYHMVVMGNMNTSRWPIVYTTCSRSPPCAAARAALASM